MSRLIRALQASLLSGVMAAGTLAVAQPPGRGGRGPGFGGPPPGVDGMPGGGPPPEVMMKMMPVLDALDADDDGTISESEIENATAALKKIDKNGDGKLSPDEMRPNFPGRGGPPGGFGRPGGFGPPGGRGPDALQSGRTKASGDADDDDDEQEEDDDDDDKLSADELTQGLRAIVMSADVNRDGFVSGDEIVAMLRRGSAGDRPQRDRASSDSQPDQERPADRGRPQSAQTDQRRPDQMRPGQIRPGQPLPGQPFRGGFGGPPRDGDPRQFFGQMFQTRDRNNDGKLQGDEIPEQMAGRLEQIDRDGDGAISRQEMEGMMSRMREGAGGPPRGGREGAEGGRRPGGDLPRRPEAEQDAEPEAK